MNKKAGTQDLNNSDITNDTISISSDDDDPATKPMVVPKSIKVKTEPALTGPIVCHNSC
jgi:hypothetical protein